MIRNYSLVSLVVLPADDDPARGVRVAVAEDEVRRYERVATPRERGDLSAFMRPGLRSPTNFLAAQTLGIVKNTQSL